MSISNETLQQIRLSLVESLDKIQLAVVDYFELGDEAGQAESIVLLERVEQTLTVLQAGEVSSLCCSLRSALKQPAKTEGERNYVGFATALLVLKRQIHNLQLPMEYDKRVLLAEEALQNDESITYYVNKSEEESLFLYAEDLESLLEKPIDNGFWSELSQTSCKIMDCFQTKESYELFWLIHNISCQAKDSSSSVFVDKIGDNKIKSWLNLTLDYLYEVLENGENLLDYQNVEPSIVSIRRFVEKNITKTKIEYNPPANNIKKNESNSFDVFPVNEKTLSSIEFVLKKELVVAYRLFEEGFLKAEITKKDVTQIKKEIRESFRFTKSVFKLLDFKPGTRLFEKIELTLSDETEDISSFIEKSCKQFVLLEDVLIALPKQSLPTEVSDVLFSNGESAYAQSLVLYRSRMTSADIISLYYTRLCHHVVANLEDLSKLDFMVLAVEAQQINCVMTIFKKEPLSEVFSGLKNIYLFIASSPDVLNEEQAITQYLNVIALYEMVSKALTFGWQIDESHILKLKKAQKALESLIAFDKTKILPLDINKKSKIILPSQMSDAIDTAFGEERSKLEDQVSQSIFEGSEENLEENLEESLTNADYVSIISNKSNERNNTESLSVSDNKASYLMASSEEMLKLDEGNSQGVGGRRSIPDKRNKNIPVFTPSEIDTSEVDSEILEIFLEEAKEVTECLSKVIPDIETGALGDELLSDTRRSFHTLKGSGRMVGLSALGDFAEQHEHLLKELLSGERAFDSSVKNQLIEGIKLASRIANSSPFYEDTDELLASAEAAHTVRYLTDNDENDELEFSDHTYEGLDPKNNFPESVSLEAEIEEADLEVTALSGIDLSDGELESNSPLKELQVDTSYHKDAADDKNIEEEDAKTSNINNEQALDNKAEDNVLKEAKVSGPEDVLLSDPESEQLVENQDSLQNNIPSASAIQAAMSGLLQMVSKDKSVVASSNTASFSENVNTIKDSLNNKNTSSQVIETLDNLDQLFNSRGKDESLSIAAQSKYIQALDTLSDIDSVSPEQISQLNKELVDFQSESLLEGLSGNEILNGSPQDCHEGQITTELAASGEGLLGRLADHPALTGSNSETTLSNAIDSFSDSENNVDSCKNDQSIQSAQSSSEAMQAAMSSLLQMAIKENPLGNQTDVASFAGHINTIKNSFDDEKSSPLAEETLENLSKLINSKNINEPLSALEQDKYIQTLDTLSDMGSANLEQVSKLNQDLIDLYANELPKTGLSSRDINDESSKIQAMPVGATAANDISLADKESSIQPDRAASEEGLLGRFADQPMLSDLAERERATAEGISRTDDSLEKEADGDSSQALSSAISNLREFVSNDDSLESPKQQGSLIGAMSELEYEFVQEEKPSWAMDMLNNIGTLLGGKFDAEGLSEHVKEKLNQALDILSDIDSVDAEHAIKLNEGLVRSQSKNNAAEDSSGRLSRIHSDDKDSSAVSASLLDEISDSDLQNSNVVNTIGDGSLVNKEQQNITDLSASDKTLLECTEDYSLTDDCNVSAELKAENESLAGDALEIESNLASEIKTDSSHGELATNALSKLRDMAENDVSLDPVAKNNYIKALDGLSNIDSISSEQVNKFNQDLVELQADGIAPESLPANLSDILPGGDGSNDDSLVSVETSAISEQSLSEGSVLSKETEASLDKSERIDVNKLPGLTTEEPSLLSDNLFGEKDAAPSLSSEANNSELTSNAISNLRKLVSSDSSFNELEHQESLIDSLGDLGNELILNANAPWTTDMLNNIGAVLGSKVENERLSSSAQEVINQALDTLSNISSADSEYVNKINQDLLNLYSGNFESEGLTSSLHDDACDRSLHGTSIESNKISSSFKQSLDSGATVESNGLADALSVNDKSYEVNGLHSGSSLCSNKNVPIVDETHKTETGLAASEQSLANTGSPLQGQSFGVVNGGDSKAQSSSVTASLDPAKTKLLSENLSKLESLVTVNNAESFPVEESLVENIYEIEASLDERAPAWAWGLLSNLEGLLESKETELPFKEEAKKIIQETLYAIAHPNEIGAKEAKKINSKLMHMKSEPLSVNYSFVSADSAVGLSEETTGEVVIEHNGLGEQADVGQTIEVAVESPKKTAEISGVSGVANSSRPKTIKEALALFAGDKTNHEAHKTAGQVFSEEIVDAYPNESDSKLYPLDGLSELSSEQVKQSLGGENFCESTASVTTDSQASLAPGREFDVNPQVSNEASSSAEDFDKPSAPLLRPLAQLVAEGSHKAINKSEIQALGAEITSSVDVHNLFVSDEEGDEQLTNESLNDDVVKGNIRDITVDSADDLATDNNVDLAYSDPSVGDSDILAIFLEEAKDIVNDNTNSLGEWQDDYDDLSSIQEIQRGMHTLKGGAGMAELNVLGSLAHDVESLLDSVAHRQINDKSEAADLLKQGIGLMGNMIGLAADRQKVYENPPYINRLNDFLNSEAGITLDSIKEKANSAPEKIVEKIAEVASDLENSIQQEKQKEEYLLRVKTKVVNQLSRLVGDDMTIRAQVERALDQHDKEVGELSQAVQRASLQIKGLQAEAENQIISSSQDNNEVNNPDYELFDALEMDCFSELQQLSHLLSETVEDLFSISSSLQASTRDIKQRLVEQSQSQRILQSTVLSMTLVRFDSILPRLERLVKQVLEQCDKNVGLHIVGGDVGVERQMLEEMTIRFEHAIRNAIAHGIESKERRKKLNKPEQGTITLTARQEGNETVFIIADDGAGFDFDAIRKKAESLNWGTKEELEDRNYLLQLPFSSGFTTMASANKIAGRGIGLDVLYSAIASRRGRLGAVSLKDKGLELTVRLPFLKTVTDALVIKLGRYRYAVPVASILGVGRLTMDLYQRFESGERSYYKYGGKEYKIESLVNFMDPSSEKELSGFGVPVLLASVDGARIAFVIEELENRQELIVNAVNNAFTGIPGVIGAALLDDGSPIPVAEITVLGQHFFAVKETSANEELQEQILVQKTVKQDLKVLVVDDSVTMRKMSSKLLLQYECEVQTAKDGLDAVDVLVDWHPDLILLDIEMPRMDGFELAKHVRNLPQLCDIPIIMITSRTGDKHRQRADEIGVNGYLGKPYTKDVLVDKIESVLNITLTAVKS